jgi:hypothetical protein
VSDDDATRRAAVHMAILRYLSRHPHAFDAVAGIRTWWLTEEGVTEEAELVEEVLDALANRGLVRRFRLADGTRVYGARADRTPPASDG